MEELRFGTFRLLPAQGALYEGPKRIKIGSRAFGLLVVLCQSPGELVSKEQLLARIWPNLHVDETALRVHVAALRKALGPGPQGEPYIVNVVGRGYRLTGPVTTVAPPVPPTRPGQASSLPPIPRALANVIGREDVIASIARQLPQHRLITIVGAGGIGKTTVATIVAEQLAGDYPDAVHFVDLSPLADDALVPAAIAFGLGVANLADDSSACVVAHLREKRLLLVLDCCERAIGGVAVLVEGILAAAPGVHLLVTSREPLRALNERVIRLAPLSTPLISAGLTAEQSASYPAVRLFMERASASLEEFALDDMNAPLVAELCIRLDGIPLAIELVAGHVNAFDLQTLAAMVSDRLSLLGPSRRTAVPRHKTLRAVLDWSFETIAARERTLLRRLAVFVGGAVLGSIQDVTADDALSRSDIVEALGMLVDKSLVVAALTAGAARYRLLDMTRAYAAEKLHESGEANAMARRHADHYRAAFATAQETWPARSFKVWLAEYSRDLDNVRAALDWAFSRDGDPLLGLELAAEALPVMYELSLTEECRRRAGVALAALPKVNAADPRLEMQLSIMLGAALMYTPGPLEQTFRAWERVLEIAEATASEAGEARALWALWTACIYGGRPREALGYAQRYAGVTIGDDHAFTYLPGERAIGVALHMMGEQHAARARLEGMLDKFVPRAVEFYTPGFQLDQGHVARVTLVRILWVMGHEHLALPMLDDVLRDMRRINHALSLGYALVEAAVPIRLMAGDVEGAARELDSLRSVADQNGFAIWQAGARAMGLALQAARGEAVGAHDVQGAFAALRATGYLAPAAWLSGIVAEAAGNTEGREARIRRLDDAIADCELTGELWNLPELLRIRATFAPPDRPGAAKALLVRAEDLARQQGAVAWERRIRATATALFGDGGYSWGLSPAGGIADGDTAAEGPPA